MLLKAKIEAIIYAAEEPISVEQISTLVKDLVLAEEAKELALAAEAAAENAETTVPAEAVADELATADPAEAAAEEIASTESPAVQTDAEAAVSAPETAAPKKKAKKEPSEDARIRARVRTVIQELVADYESNSRGLEVRAVAGGYRMSTKPEHHDVVRAFAKSLKPPVRLSLAALETLAVIAYKQPVTVPEISEIRGVEAGGVIGTLLDRKLITTAGRKQVIGRPILYKTSKEFLMRFGLNDVSELPSMEEFEKLASDGQGELFTPDTAATQQSSPESAVAPPTGDSQWSEADSASVESTESKAPAADASENAPDIEQTATTNSSE